MKLPWASASVFPAAFPVERPSQYIPWIVSLKDQPCSLLRHCFSIIFFPSPILFLKQHFRNTMSCFHRLTFFIEIALCTSWRSPSSWKYVSLKDFLDHLLHLLLANMVFSFSSIVITWRNIAYNFPEKSFEDKRILTVVVFPLGYCLHFLLHSSRTFFLQILFLEWQGFAFAHTSLRFP